METVVAFAAVRSRHASHVTRINTQHTIAQSILQPFKRANVCFLFLLPFSLYVVFKTFSDAIAILCLLWSTFSFESNIFFFHQVDGKTLCSDAAQIVFEVSEIPAREYHCMSWLCQMTCCLGLFSFLFYTCCCVSNEGFGATSSHVLTLQPKARFWKPWGTGTEIDLLFQ